MRAPSDAGAVEALGRDLSRLLGGGAVAPEAEGALQSLIALAGRLASDKAAMAAMIAAQEARIAELAAQLAALTARIAQLQRDLYGSRSEWRREDGDGSDGDVAAGGKDGRRGGRPGRKEERGDAVNDTGLRFNGQAPVIDIAVTPPEIAGLSEDDYEVVSERVHCRLADRRSRALQRRLKRAKLRHQDACFEKINLTRPRGLDQSVVLALGDCAWIHNGATILITGPTGTGKSWISCALAHKACLEGFQALYLRVPRLLNDLRIAHGEGTIARLYRDLARIDLLVLDDWGLAPIDATRGRDLLEILDDRSGRRPVIVTSQLPVSDWHRQLKDPSLADAILDRLVHGATRFELHGASMRIDHAGAGTGP